MTSWVATAYRAADQAQGIDDRYNAVRAAMMPDGRALITDGACGLIVPGKVKPQGLTKKQARGVAGLLDAVPDVTVRVEVGALDVAGLLAIGPHTLHSERLRAWIVAPARAHGVRHVTISVLAEERTHLVFSLGRAHALVMPYLAVAERTLEHPALLALAADANRRREIAAARRLITDAEERVARAEAELVTARARLAAVQEGPFR